MDTTSVSVSALTGIIIFAGSYLVWRALRVVLAPLARAWRERPVVIWDDHEQRWRAAPRLSDRL